MNHDKPSYEIIVYALDTVQLGILNILVYINPAVFVRTTE
jgi:hypothetical protein